MATIFKLPRAVAVDSSGTPYAGAKANFYLTGTSTPTDTYSDADLTTPNANPVVADSAGLFGIIYFDPSVTYKLVLTQSDDTEIYTEDPVSESTTVVGNDIITKTATYTTVAGDEGKVIECTGTFTLTLLPAATAAAGFTQVVTNVGTGIITVDGNASETINGKTTVVLGVNESLFIACDGSNWAGVHSTSATNQVETITGAETVAVADRNRVYNVTSGTFTMDLLAAATAGEGFAFTVVNQGSGTVTIDPNSTETINGVSTFDLVSGSSVICVCTGSEWLSVTAPVATTSLQGISELATGTEVIAGNDGTRAVTPDALGDMIFSYRYDAESFAKISSSDSASGWTVADAAELGKADIVHNLGLSGIENLVVDVTASREAASSSTGGSHMNAEVQEEGVNGFSVQITQMDSTRVEAGAVNIIAYRVP